MNLENVGSFWWMNCNLDDSMLLSHPWCVYVSTSMCVWVYVCEYVCVDYVCVCVCLCVCVCVYTVCVCVYAEREPRCTRACAWRMCMWHMHVHADWHSGHVLVECVRCLGPWEEGRECMGACVAWCDLALVYVCGLHVCTCLYWHWYSDAYFIIHVSIINKWRRGNLDDCFQFLSWLCSVIMKWESVVCWHLIQ